MIEPAHALPVSRQAELLELSRSNVYYLPRPASEADLALMRRNLSREKRVTTHTTQDAISLPRDFGHSLLHDAGLKFRSLLMMLLPAAGEAFFRRLFSLGV